jgi:hypothetical protein
MFDKYAQPACPSQLTMPLLHKVLTMPALQPYVWGGKVARACVLPVSTSNPGTFDAIGGWQPRRRHGAAFVQECRGSHQGLVWGCVGQTYVILNFIVF